MFEYINNIKIKDPSMKHIYEIILYPCFYSIIFHRIAHFFYNNKLFFIAKLISQISRKLTLIEIHPGAKIGKNLFIDHGIGTIIGETSIIGDNVTIYHGVTLGCNLKEKGKRHPTIKDNVTICSNAQILGNIIVGENAIIGSSSVVLNDVPNDVTIAGIPGKIVKNIDYKNIINLLEIM